MENETEKTKSILNNAIAENHPVTTWFGRILILFAIVLLFVQYIVPPISLLWGVDKATIELLRTMVAFPWFVVLIIGCVGVVFLFLNEERFNALFGIGTGYLKNKAGVKDDKPEQK